MAITCTQQSCPCLKCPAVIWNCNFMSNSQHISSVAFSRDVESWVAWSIWWFCLRLSAFLEHFSMFLFWKSWINSSFELLGLRVCFAHQIMTQKCYSYHIMYHGTVPHVAQVLTHWGRDKMAAIFQTSFSNAFSWMKMYEFRLKFHWCLFLSVQLAIFQHWFR